MLRFASLGLLLTIGCASNDQIPPSDLEYDDLALSVGSTVAMPSGGGELGAFGDVVAIAHGLLPKGFAAAADGTISGDHTGLGYRYQVLCRNAQGAVEACGTTTDAFDAQVAWTGALQLPDTGMQFERTGPWAVSGLTQPVATATGTATLAYDSRIANPDRGTVSTYHLTYAATYDNVAYDTAALKALGGDIRYALSVIRTETRSAQMVESEYQVDAMIALAGDGTATMDLDGTHQYTLNLTTGVVVRR